MILVKLKPMTPDMWYDAVQKLEVLVVEQGTEIEKLTEYLKETDNWPDYQEWTNR